MLVVVLAVIIAAVSIFTTALKDKEQFDYSDMVTLFNEDLVTSFNVDGKLVMTIESIKPQKDASGDLIRGKDGKALPELDSKGEIVKEKNSYQLSYNFQLDHINELALRNYSNGFINGENGPRYTNLTAYNYEVQAQTPWYQAYLPLILLMVIFGVFYFFMMRGAGGGGKINSFAKSRAKLSGEKNTVKFADVAGADEEKAELEEVVEFLKDPQKYVKLGARIPRGVLLVGPPGTGKTLLAKAVAGEAGVPFFSISGSDFVELYVGVGASRVRDLFDNARKTPASIIFIDEIDAVGRHRGAGLGGGHDEREQTLNQLLVEMDGFGTNSGVIVIAATNRPDILDPALLRPGRFDRQVTVNYPDIKGREEILKVHCRNKPLEATVDLKKIAQTTIGFTGAELANLLNEAALHAAKKNKSLIGMDDIEASYMKMLLGPQKKAKVRREEDNKLCAYHEAGHAVASYFCKHTDPVKHITIIPAGNAGGVTISVPTEDKMGATKNEMLDRIVLALGGRVAEELVLDDISTGASNDIKQATSIARNMVTRYGMSDKLGTVLYGSEHSSDEVFLGRDFSSGKGYSEKTASDIDDEIRNIIASAYERCKQYLTEHMDKLQFVAEFLLKYEYMDEDQFIAAMERENPTFEEIDAIAAERRSKSEEENKTAKEKNEREEEEERRRCELAKKIADSKSDDMLESFFRDMQNGTLHDSVDISGASGPLDIDGDGKPDSENETEASDSSDDKKSNDSGSEN
ncbi:MAG: ATP-dependent zinc metalloprotease FtsH [Clostridia bacterium]|nr:ATP-dependent zinc metalloprotease FtsH [Clostridia bacterium]